MVAMSGAIIPAPLAMPARVTVLPPARTRRIPRFGNASVVRIASPASGSPFGSSRFARPGRAATILPTGRGTPMTPVEPTSRESFGRPRTSQAAREVSRTAAVPAAPVQAFAFPLFTTIPRRRPRFRFALPQTTGAAATRFRVNTTAETHGRSLTTSARSGFPVRLIPQGTPAARNPRTTIAFGILMSGPLAAAFLVLLPGAARARVVPADLGSRALLRGLPGALDV